MPYLIGNQWKSQGGAGGRYSFLRLLTDTYKERKKPKLSVIRRKNQGYGCPLLWEVQYRFVGGSFRYMGLAGKDIGVTRKAPFSGFFRRFYPKRSLIIWLRVLKRAVFPPKKAQNAHLRVWTGMPACPVLLEAVENVSGGAVRPLRPPKKLGSPPFMSRFIGGISPVWNAMSPFIGVSSRFQGDFCPGLLGFWGSLPTQPGRGENGFNAAVCPFLLGLSAF